jgi:nitroreductase
MMSSDPGQPSPSRFISLNFSPVEPETCLERAQQLYAQMDRRRSVRHFIDRPVPREVIGNLIRTASTSPSGAHRQPWTFIAVSNADTKTEIRKAAEEEERLAYEQRMPAEWLDALQPLGTDWQKPYLETAPWLVVVFQQSHEILASGKKRKNYYVAESVGIAVGVFLTAVHQVGLVALTHTPSPMGFLSDILQRPSNEKAFAIIPIGYPADDCQVPDLQRKGLDEVAVFLEKE